MKIAATVILYNPKDDVFDNIESYIKGVDLLIVVDNSTQHNIKLIDKLKDSFTNILYINNNDNLGIATALNIACYKAIELDYDWILTMDQDSRFLDFKSYIACLQKVSDKQNLAIIAANTQWNAKNHIVKEPSYDYEEKSIVITSANFLNLSIFKALGGFEEKLFIDMVDYDYCLKVNSQDYKIFYFKDVLVEHSLGDLIKRKNLFTRKIKEKIEHNPQRVYYITRNYLYISKVYGKKFPKKFNFIRSLNILFIHEVTKILIYEDQKLKKLYSKLVGLFHFIIGKYGKYTI